LLPDESGVPVALARCAPTKIAGGFSLFEVKAAEDSRTPKPGGIKARLDSAIASWSARSPLPLFHSSHFFGNTT